MSGEIPLEIIHLCDRLRQDFSGKLPEATSGTDEEKERNFLSRALAAFAIQYLSGCTLDEAVIAMVDGSGDSGMDALYYSPTAHRLWIVQSKFFANAQGEPSLGDVSKFKNGLEALMQGQFEVFRGNAALAQKIPQLQAHFDIGRCKLKRSLFTLVFIWCLRIAFGFSRICDTVFHLIRIILPSSITTSPVSTVG